MKKKIVIPILALIIIVGIAAIYFITSHDLLFSAGGRYDDTNLDYMGVIYQNQSDIHCWNEGYSDSDDCPWGFKHQGLDYFFNDSSPVIAAAPGRVEEIALHDSDAEGNTYHVAIWIRFNQTVELGYNFEPWTTDESDRERQIEQFTVKEGDWVEKGEKIADFVACAESAHIHFDVIENDKRICHKKYFDDTGYSEIMDLIHSFHPDWDLCYN